MNKTFPLHLLTVSLVFLLSVPGHPQYMLEAYKQSCVTNVNGQESINPEVYTMLNEIVTEFICQTDMDSCREARRLLRGPLPEELVAEEEARLAGEESEMADNMEVTEGETDALQEFKRREQSALSAGLSGMMGYHGDTEARATFAATGAIANKASSVANNMSSAVQSRLASRFSQVRNQAARRIQERATGVVRSQLLKRSLNIATGGAATIFGFSGVLPFLAGVAGAVALDHFRQDSKVAYLSKCSGDKRTLGAQSNLGGRHPLVVEEQGYSWGNQPIGPCHPSITFHPGIYHFLNYGPQEKLDHLKSGKTFDFNNDGVNDFCQNLRAIHKRMTTKPPIKIQSCQENQLRFSIGDSSYRDFLGEEITVIGSFQGNSPQIHRVHFNGQSREGKTCVGPAHYALNYINPRVENLCSASYGGTCRKLYSKNEKQRQLSIGMQAPQLYEKEHCIQTRRDCHAGFTVNELAQSFKSGGACKGKRYIMNQVELSRGLNSTYQRLALCCARYASRAVGRSLNDCQDRNIPAPTQSEKKAVETIE